MKQLTESRAEMTLKKNVSETEAPSIDPRQKLVYPLQETGFHRIAVWLLRALYRAVFTIEAEGLRHIPESGALVLAANHLTNFDILPMQLAFPRPIFYMGKAELFRNPILHYFFRQLGGFPVFRGARDEWAIRHALKLLRKGQTIGMFPEGTRSHGRGLSVAKTGAARLALEVKCPILPMAIDGSQDIFQKFPRRAQVNIKFGEPLWPEEGELPLVLTDRLMFALARNLPPALRGVYASVPKGL